jgi:hypothetical protein
VIHASKILAIVVIVAALSWQAPASATSCAEPVLETSIERADVVFVGLAGPKRDLGHGAAIVPFTVDRVYRGRVPSVVLVMAGGIKGAMVDTGQKYLVFATLRPVEKKGDPPLFAHLCGGSQLAAQAGPWIAELGHGDRPAFPDEPIQSGKPPPAPELPPDPPPDGGPPKTAPPPAVDPSPAAPKDPPPQPAKGGGCAGCAAPGTAPRGGAALAALVLGAAIARGRARTPLGQAPARG